MTQPKRTVTGAIITAMTLAGGTMLTELRPPSRAPRPRGPRPRPKSHDGNKLALRLKRSKRLFRV